MRKPRDSKNGAGWTTVVLTVLWLAAMSSFIDVTIAPKKDSSGEGIAFGYAQKLHRIASASPRAEQGITYEIRSRGGDTKYVTFLQWLRLNAYFFLMPAFLIAYACLQPDAFFRRWRTVKRDA